MQNDIFDDVKLKTILDRYAKTSNSSKFFDRKSENSHREIGDTFFQLTNVKTAMNNEILDGWKKRQKNTLPIESKSLLDELYFTLEEANKDLYRKCEEARRDFKIYLKELDESWSEWNQKKLQDLYQQACKDTGKTLTWEQFKDKDYLLALKLEKAQKEIEEMLKKGK